MSPSKFVCRSNVSGHDSINRTSCFVHLFLWILLHCLNDSCLRYFLLSGFTYHKLKEMYMSKHSHPVVRVLNVVFPQLETSEIKQSKCHPGWACEKIGIQHYWSRRPFAMKLSQKPIQMKVTLFLQLEATRTYTHEKPHGHTHTRSHTRAHTHARSKHKILDWVLKFWRPCLDLEILHPAIFYC